MFDCALVRFDVSRKTRITEEHKGKDFYCVIV